MKHSPYYKQAELMLKAIPHVAAERSLALKGGTAINLFVWPEASNAVRSSDARALRGFHVRHWVRGGMSYWAVSDVSDADLDEFVRALQQ